MMDNMEKKFIATFNEESAKKLMQMGYELFSKEYGRFVFLNSKKIMQQFDKLKDVYFTNTLFF